jgi:hypothetical protein
MGEGQKGEKVMGCDSQFDEPKSLVDRRRTNRILVKDKGPRVDTTMLPPIAYTVPPKAVPETIEIVSIGDPVAQPGPCVPGAYEESGKDKRTAADSYEARQKANDEGAARVGTPGCGAAPKPLAPLQEHRPPLTAFEQELRHLINCFSKESGSNTPDVILAEYLSSCLNAFNIAVSQRERWYGRRIF